jgi:hypothetical protein
MAGEFVINGVGPGSGPMTPWEWSPNWGNYYSAGQQADASKYGADKQAATAAAGFASQQAIAAMQAQASALPALLAQGRFATIWPYLSGQLAQAGNFGRGFGAAPKGLGPAPAAPSGTVFSEPQIQERVNATRSANDIGAAAQTRQTSQQLAGRGFGGNSPLAQALNNATWGQNLAANTEGEREARLGAAEANTKYGLQANQIAQQAYSSRQEEAIKRQQIGAQTYSALLAALAGLA